MLDINEYNKLLYRQLDRKAEEKSMISDYGRYLQHSKSKETESGIELQAATWLANFRGLTTSNGFLKTPQGMKEICEGLIPQASKLLRKANKKGAPEETKAELRNARKFLEDCLADANAALEHSDKDPEHLEHGGKWRHHDYIDIKNGRYIYAKDKKPNREALQKLENLKKIEAKNTQYVKDKYHEATQAGANYRLAKAFDPEEKNASTQEQRKKAEETDKVFKDSFRIASLSNKSARDAIKKEAKESAEAKAKRQQIDAETDARKRAANEAKGQAEAEAKAKWQEQKVKEEQNKMIYDQNAIGASKAAEDRAKKEKENAYNMAQPKTREEAEKKSTKATQEKIAEYNSKREQILKDAYEYHEMLKRNGHSLADWSRSFAYDLDNAYKDSFGSYSGDSGASFTKQFEEYAKKREKEVKHSAMAATAMSRDEYEELLKKAESLT